MSPRRARTGARSRGSGPDGRITPEDIKAKAQDLAGGVDQQIQAKGSLVRYAAVGGVVVVVLVVFWLGRRSGHRRSTVVEIRRG
jgi:hypothetical protein